MLVTSTYVHRQDRAVVPKLIDAWVRRAAVHSWLAYPLL